MEQGKEYAELAGISVTLTESRPRFNGNYSDVHIGRFGDKIVAVKIIKHIRGKALETMQRKITREMKLWAALNHPNIAPFYGYAQDEQIFGLLGALISPWYENGDAARFLAEHGEQMDVLARSTLWMGVIAGVHYLHSYSPVIVHGDLKPGNVLIDDYRNARLCDFGISRVVTEAGTSGLTTTSAHNGTQRYLSYELVVSEDACSPTTASDVYALGCIGFEFTHLQCPYASRQHNIFRAIEKKLPPAIRPSSLSESLIGLWNLFESCWALEPASRPSVDNVMTAYKQWHDAYTHCLEQKDRKQGMSAVSLSSTVRATHTLSNISMPGSENTEAPMKATEHNVKIINTPFLSNTVRSTRRQPDNPIPDSEGTGTPVKATERSIEIDTDKSIGRSRILANQSIDIKSLTEATRLSFQIIEPWADAKSGHDLVTTIIISLRHEAKGFFECLHHSYLNAQSGYSFAKMTEELCDLLLDPNGTYSDNIIKLYIEDMQEIATKAHEEATTTANMFRASRQGFNAITAKIPVARETLGCEQADAEVSRSTATRRAEGWESIFGRFLTTDNNSRSTSARGPLQVAGALISLPVVITLAVIAESGAKVLSAQAKERRRRSIRYGDAIKTFETAVENLQELMQHMDLLAAYWRERNATLEDIKGRIGDLRNNRLLQLKIQDLKKDWNTVGSEYLNYERALANLGDHSRVYRPAIASASAS